MSAYVGTSRSVKNALKTLLSLVTYDVGNGEEAAFVNILGSTHGELEGHPAVRVLPGDVLTEKASVAENERTLTYILRVHLPLEDTAESSEQTYDYMYDLTDLVIDKLDVGDFTNLLHDIDPDLPTYFLNARRGDWFVTESEAGILLMCDINVELRYSKDLA